MTGFKQFTENILKYILPFGMSRSTLYNVLFALPDKTESFPTFDFITFMCYREANCIGQIALWRRLLGYEAMNKCRRTDSFYDRSFQNQCERS